jgi:hypothetical protein
LIPTIKTVKSDTDEFGDIISKVAASGPLPGEYTPQGVIEENSITTKGGADGDMKEMFKIG